VNATIAVSRHWLNNPAARLFQAVQRYTDGLHVAAEQLVGHQTVAEFDQADQYIHGLTTEPAWPTQQHTAENGSSFRSTRLAAPVPVLAPLQAAPRLLLNAEAEHRHGT
jgi:hypothetical protein